jgi:hypothetical protein
MSSLITNYQPDDATNIIKTTLRVTQNNSQDINNKHNLIKKQESCERQELANQIIEYVTIS